MNMIDDFKNTFPEFDPAIIDQHWANVSNTWCCYYGGTYNNCNKMIILYLLAHLLQLRIMEIDSSSGKGADDSIGRSIASLSVGNVSESYFQNTDESRETSFFYCTTYGRQYLTLISKNNGGIWV